MFVEALLTERQRAEKMERDDPMKYQLGGALNWQNGDISTFLEGALQYFKNHDDQIPSWKLLAEFLYFGKIYE